MGSGESKPVAPASSQVWTSETPVRFAPGLVDSLQNSPESDSTRAKTLELHIQSRVREELQALSAQTTKDLSALQAKISALEASSSSSSSSQSPSNSDNNKSAGDTLRDLSREAVQNEVQELKKKLEGRKKITEVDEGVERAKSEVVRCLRENDRRPLDCWREVKAFKEEVKRLEGRWVEKVVRE